MIAIFPLRKGSRRLKNKNILKIKDKKLYEYTLDKLIKSKKIKKIIISTDYNFFFKKINNSKILLHKRDGVLAKNCSMNKVIYNILNIFDFDINQSFIQLHATSPLLRQQTIDKAIKKYYSKKKFDSLFSITENQKRYWIYKNKKIIPYNHKLESSPTTQNLKKIYEENSGFYIFSKKSFLHNKNNRIGKFPQIYKLSKIESIDIDDKDDFKIAKSIISAGSI